MNQLIWNIYCHLKRSIVLTASTCKRLLYPVLRLGLKPLCLLLFIFSTSGTIYSQDTLKFKSGEKLVVNILEGNLKVLKYHLHEDGPFPKLHVVELDELDKISYASGFVKEFSSQQNFTAAPILEIDPLTYDFGRHFIALNILDVAIGPLTVSYEHIFSSGDFSFRVPLSFGTEKGSDYEGFHLEKRKKFSTGLDLNIYPSGQGRTRFFFGPSIEYGFLERKWYTYSESPDQVVSYWALLWKNGVIFQATEHFNWALTGAIGISDSNEDLSRNLLVARGGVLLGYKF